MPKALRSVQLHRRCLHDRDDSWLLAYLGLCPRDEEAVRGSIVLKRVQHTLMKNSPVLLTAAAVTGVISTTYLAARAGWNANEIIRKDEEANGHIPNRTERYKRNAKLVWKEFIPATAAGTVTVVAIVGSNRISGKRAAAAQAAFVLTEHAYSEYRDKVVEEIGEKKDKAIRDKIAEQKVHLTPPPQSIISGPGIILCCELLTGRYFTSDMENLRRAVNYLNERLLKHDRMTLDDWYHEIGLRPTTMSSDFGWESDRLMELEFSTVMSEDGRPCIAFEYNYITPIHFH